MHMLVAFIVSSLVGFWPIAWCVGLAHSFGNPVFVNGNKALLISIGFTLAFGLIVALAVGGIWAVVSILLER